MVAFNRRRAQAPRTSKRVAVVFAPPGAGASTLCTVLQQASETSIDVVPYYGPESIAIAAEALEHSDVVLLDVDAGILTAACVQAIVDSGLIHVKSGCIIRIAAPHDVILRRTAKVTDTDLHTWQSGILDTEHKIREHSLPYFMISNHGSLAESVQQLAQRIGVKK